MSKTPERQEPADSSGARNRDPALIRQLGESLRRVEGDESYDKNGIRTIWHRGSMHTELLTWEDKQHQVVKQELCFLGLVVEHKRGEPVRTGRLHKKDDGSNPGAQVTHDVRLESSPVSSTLERSWQLLRLVPDRDFYVQHLLKVVGEAMAELGLDDDRTAVAASPNDFSRAPRKKPSKAAKIPKVKVKKPPRRIKAASVLKAVVLVAIIGGLAAVLSYLVWLAT